MAQVTLDDRQLAEINRRINVVEDKNRELEVDLAKAKDEIAGLKLETGSLRSKVGGFS
jgi:predicted  nucleic acid-binding Zn-ribbon protein